MSLIQAKQINKLLGVLKTFNAAFTLAAGATVDLSTTFTGKTAGGSDTAAGVFTASPQNRIALVNDFTGNPVDDGAGNQVYARLNGSFLATFYTVVSGVETAYTVLAGNAAVGKTISVIYGEAVQFKDVKATDVLNGLDSVDETDIDPNSHYEQIDTFTPTAAQTAFTLTKLPKAGSIKMFVNGQLTDDFTNVTTAVTYLATFYAMEVTDKVLFIYNSNV